MTLQTKGKTRLHKNAGYSLVEMVICMAIIAILTGLSFVTISLINSARAREASVDFESEVANLISKSKNQVCVVDGNREETYFFCMKVYKQGSKYYYKTGYYNPKESAVGEKTIATGEEYKNTRYIFVEGENNNKDKGVSTSSKVDVKYGESAYADETSISEAGQYIIFNRSGRCISGDGVYSFYKASNNSLIATVTINKNGSHQSK